MGALTDKDEDEESWSMEQRRKVVEYLAGQGMSHGRIGEWPAWHVTPYVSVWAIESGISPEFIGWWAIAGDLPTDYISSAEVAPPQHPRKAIAVFARKWSQLVERWESGREIEGYSIGTVENRMFLTPLLKSRAEFLLNWAEDDACWEE